jgi:hypothetical protein
VTVAPEGKAPVFRRRPRRAVERLALEAALPVLVVLTGAVVVGDGPVDHQFYRWLAAIAAGVAVLLTVPLFLLRLTLGRRVSVVLTPDGIDSGLPRPGRISWSDVSSAHAVWRASDRQILLTRRIGPPVGLYAPRGSAWLPDPEFRREVARFGQWSARQGSVMEQMKSPRWTVAAVALVVLVALGAAGVRAVDRGVIWPWTPTAARATAACPALQAAGLERFWPADTRTLERDEQDRMELGEYSYCWWVRSLDRPADAPYIRLSAVVRRHSAFMLSSPIAMAVDSYRSDLAAESSTQPVPGLGDEAFMSSADDGVLVAARRANVTVSIGVDLDLRQRPEAEAAARALTAAILAGVRLGGGS